ncbi:hypothetical protein [Dankookia rubra]|uniref:hypothetical protein n=1 Tax=Dankookia rubra TaxID=1442381 RepID=UPI00351A350D
MDAGQSVETVLGSKFDHRMDDILRRWRIGELPMVLVEIVSNHPREASRISTATSLASTACRSPAP